MNNPQQLRRKISDELAKHPFPASIERLNTERQTQLEIQQSYTELLTTATSLPQVLEQRITEVNQQIEFERAVHENLQQLTDEHRNREMQSLHEWQAKYSTEIARSQQICEQLAEEWQEIKDLSTQLTKLSVNGGLTAQQIRQTECLRMLQRLPLRMDSSAVRNLELNPDELWERMVGAADQLNEPVVPLLSKYPQIQQFLARD